MRKIIFSLLIFACASCLSRGEHPSIGGKALDPAEVAANMFELEGQVVKINFSAGPAKQTSREYYEVQVPGDTLVLIPVEIGKKWFSPNSKKNLPDKLLVKVELGEVENQYGKKDTSAILIAVGTKSRRGMSYDDLTFEW